MPNHEVRLIWNAGTDDLTVQHTITMEDFKEGDTITFRAFQELTPLVTFKDGSPFNTGGQDQILDSEPKKVLRVVNDDGKGFQFECEIKNSATGETLSTGKGDGLPHPGGGKNQKT